MKIEHYNAIAKIVGGTLDNNDRLHPMVNTLTSYFESVDENFNPKEFRSACLNGHFMEEPPKTDVEYQKEEITPTTVENKAYNWRPKIQHSVRGDNIEYREAIARMNKRNTIHAKQFVKKEK